METSLHQSMKRLYADDESQIEQRLGRFIIDVLKDDELIEVQFSSLASINRKIETLVKDHKVRVVKPLILRKQLVRCSAKGEPAVSRRKSPKRGSLLDIFDELIYFTRVFPHRNLTIEVPLVNIEEWTYPTPKSKKRRRRPPKKYTVEDQRLVDVVETHEFRTSKDLAKLLPKDLGQPFDTADLAKAMGIKRWIAQKIAYCMKHMKAIKPTGKKGNAILYRLPSKKKVRRRRKKVA